MCSRQNTQRFAVVVCEDAEKWGGKEVIGERFKSLLKRPSDIEWRTFNACSGEIPTEEELDRYQGYVISGSHYSVNDDKEWIRNAEQFICSVANKSPASRLVGICFGHQLVAKALGGTVGPNPTGKLILQTEKVSATEDLSRILDVSKVFQNGSLRLLESHSECVTELPAGAVSVAKSTSCDNEMSLFTDNILGIQAHPECTAEEFEEKILPSVMNAKLFTEEDKVEVQESFKAPLDSKEIITMLSDFLHR